MHKKQMKYLVTKCMAIRKENRYNGTHSLEKRKDWQNISGKAEKV